MNNFHVQQLVELSGGPLCGEMRGIENNTERFTVYYTRLTAEGEKEFGAIYEVDQNENYPYPIARYVEG